LRARVGTRGLGCLRVAVQGEGPEDGLDLVMGRAAGILVLRLAFIQRGGVVSGVAEIGVGAVGGQPPDAGGRPAVAPCGVQGQYLCKRRRSYGACNR
jgi:hypothetical protein